MGFVFTNFQADNYGTSSGDDEGVAFTIERMEVNVRGERNLQAHIGPT